MRRWRLSWRNTPFWEKQVRKCGKIGFDTNFKIEEDEDSKNKRKYLIEWRAKEEESEGKEGSPWIQVMTPRKKMYVVVPNLPGTPQSFKLDFSCYYTNIRISRPHMNANNITYKINIKNLVTRKICIIMAYCFRRKAVGYLLNLKCYLLHKLLWRKSSIKFLLLDEKFVECFFSAFQDWLFCSARYHNSI